MRPPATTSRRSAPFRSERELVFRGLAVDQEFRSARLLRGRQRAGAVALLAHHEQQREIAHAFGQQFSTAKIMDAMMPLVSHAPRPQMYSSSSREGKNGGTVSMCVESVTTGSPHQASTLKRFGSTS